MVHPANHLSYHQLALRLNRFPQGAPATDSLFDILKILFSEKETRLVAQLPLRSFNVRKASRAWNKPAASFDPGISNPWFNASVDDPLARRTPQKRN